MRKKTVLTVLAGLVIMAGLSNLSMAAANQISHYLHYDDTPVIGTDTLGGVTYSTFSYGDLFNSGEPGKPSLPVDYIRFSVPYNATNFSATVTWRMNVSYNLDHLLYPCQAPRWMNDTTPATITLPDSAAYYSGESYPSQRAWVVDEGFLEGENHIVTVAVMPFSYRHSESSDLVSLRKTGTLRLSYELSDSLAIYPIVREDSALREEGYRLAQSMVVNPNQVKSFTVSYSPIGTGVGPIGPINPNGVLPGDGVNGGSLPFFPKDSLTRDSDYVDPNPGIAYDAYARIPYLIVTTNEFCHSLRRLAALKRQKGYNVKIVTLDDIYNDPFSRYGDIVNGQLVHTDEAGKIRQYLRTYFKYFGTQYVLLAGDIPSRYVTLRFNQFETKTCTVPTDLYYSEMNKDWLDNDVECYSDLSVGRLIAKSEEQVSNYTEKLFRYELNPGDGDYDYLKRAFYSVGYDFFRGSELMNVRMEMDSIYPEATVLLEPNDLYDKSKYPSGDAIVDTINMHKYGFISLHHHGSPAGIVTSGFRQQACRDYLRFLWAVDSVHIYTQFPFAENHDPSTTNGLNRLDNKWYPSIGYTTACISMPFDIIPGYESMPMNFGESFTTGKDYGGPAFLGNTRDGYTPYTGLLEMVFGRKINQGYYKIGRANGLAKSYLTLDIIARDYSSVNQNLLGDPELEVWTDIPGVITDCTINRSDSSITVSNLMIDHAYVAYCSLDNKSILKQASSSSMVFDHISPNGTIMVYKHNYIPLIAPLEIQNCNINTSNYIIANDVSIGNNVNSHRTTGNVTINSGVNFEIEASGTVTLSGGFNVEPGATFTVYPSSF